MSRLLGAVGGLAVALLILLVPSATHATRSMTRVRLLTRDRLLALPADGPYLHADGAVLRDSPGRRVRLSGINWFGLETCNFAPDGLGVRAWWDLLDQARTLGFNTIRLPFSSQLLEPISYPRYVNYALNPDLRGLSGLQVMDRIVHGAGARGLRIILDRHRPGCAAQSPLWYTPHYLERRWIADLVRVVRRYRHEPAVIGVDLHNEPHDAATWGDGNLATDWRLAAERAGNAVLRANPHLLIFVQGVQTYHGDTYWWGGNLEGAATAPVRLAVPHRLVYEAHDYGAGVYWQGWFSSPDFPRNLPRVWRRHWAYLQEDGIAPVLMGEFGGRSVTPTALVRNTTTRTQQKEAVWQRGLIAFLARHPDVGFMYWSFTPDSSDTGGVLNDDWQTASITKETLLTNILGASLPVPGAAPPPAAVRVQASDVLATNSDQQSLTVRIVNDGPRPLSLAGAMLRYWLSRPDAGAMPTGTVSGAPRPGTVGSASPLSLSGTVAMSTPPAMPQTRVADVDWSSTGPETVTAVTGTTRGYPYVALRIGPPTSTVEALPPYGGVATIVVRLHRADWRPFAPQRDWSYTASVDPVPAPHLTLDVNGRRLWGDSPRDLRPARHRVRTSPGRLTRYHDPLRHTEERTTP